MDLNALRHASQLPDSASVTLPVPELRELLELLDTELVAHVPHVLEAATEVSWRERLWTCAEETRLNVRELADALDRSPDYVYRATSMDRAKDVGRDPLPCQKLDGQLVFVVGAVRRWLRASETIVNPEPDISFRKRA